MRKARTSKLNLLALENRLTPAVNLVFSGGNLTVTGDNQPNAIYISGPANALNVSAVAKGSTTTILGTQINSAAFTDADGSGNPAGSTLVSLGTYNVTGNITVNGGNSADFVVFRLADGTTLPGNVSVSTGNGNDDILIETQNNAPATIAGRLTLNGGLGADFMNVFDYNLQGLVSVTGGGSGLRPNQDLSATAPNDVLQFADLTAASQVLVTDVNVRAVDGLFGTTTTFSNSLIVNNTTANASGQLVGTPDVFAVAPRKIFSGVLALDANGVINGNIVYSGSTAGDAVVVGGTLNGSLTVVGRGGNDLFEVLGGTTLNGGLSAIFGVGADSVSFGNGANLFGSVNVNTGDGTNAYDLNNTFFVAGDLAVTAGNGDDNFGTTGIGGGVGVNGTVSGRVSFNLGNGTNSIFYTGSISGTSFSYTGGGGQDSLTFNASTAASLIVNLGAGADSLVFGGGPNQTIGSATLDFGVDNDVDSFVVFPGTTVTFGSVVIRNLP